jgi:hypothetical protein
MTMKTFVIFGDIEFNDNTALVHRVHHSGFYADEDIAPVADKHGGDWLAPHHFEGTVTFVKHHKENF